MLLHQLEWKRRKQPVLSAMTTTESWCRVGLYNPTVIRVGDRYLMWYVGNSMVVDPWGETVESLDDREGVLTAEVDLSLVAKTRAEFPVILDRVLTD